MSRIAIRLDSAAAIAHLRRWQGEFDREVRQAVGKGVRESARTLKERVREHVGSQLKVVKKSFLKGFTTRIYDSDPARLPALYVGSRIPWVGIHESGGSIGGKLLIPLHGRIGRKAFKALVTGLIRGGNAWFVKNAAGHIVLMAENLPEHAKLLGGVKRRYRKATDRKRLKRGEDIPIAVLVNQVAIRQRLDVRRLVAAEIPTLAIAVEQQLRKLA